MNTTENLNAALQHALLYLKAAREVASNLDTIGDAPLSPEDRSGLDEALTLMSAIDAELDAVGDAITARIEKDDPGYLASLEEEIDDLEDARASIHGAEFRREMLQRLAKLWGSNRATGEGETR